MLDVFEFFLKKYKPRIVEFDGIIVGMVLVYLYFILCMMGMYFYTERVREEVHVTLNRKKPPYSNELESRLVR